MELMHFSIALDGLTLEDKLEFINHLLDDAKTHMSETDEELKTIKQSLEDYSNVLNEIKKTTKKEIKASADITSKIKRDAEGLKRSGRYTEEYKGMEDYEAALASERRKRKSRTADKKSKGEAKSEIKKIISKYKENDLVTNIRNVEKYDQLISDHKIDLKDLHDVSSEDKDSMNKISALRKEALKIAALESPSRNDKIELRKKLRVVIDDKYPDQSSEEYKLVNKNLSRIVREAAGMKTTWGDRFKDLFGGGKKKLEAAKQKLKEKGIDVKDMIDTLKKESSKTKQQSKTTRAARVTATPGNTKKTGRVR